MGARHKTKQRKSNFLCFVFVIPAVKMDGVVCLKHSMRYANLAMCTHTTLSTQHSLHNTPDAQYA